MPSDPVSGKDPLSGLKMGAFLLSPHMEGRWGQERDRERDTETEKTSLLVSFYGALILSFLTLYRRQGSRLSPRKRNAKRQMAV